MDVFLPLERLALEYQGQQHFGDIFFLGSEWRYAERDADKRETCEGLGITLIEVPYWWNLEVQKLVASIQRKRTDLILDCVPNLISNKIDDSE